MYAIVEISGKQYKVGKNQILYVDKLNIEENEKLILDKVLLLKTDDYTKIGMPYVENAKIETQVIDAEIKDKKVIVYKFKNKTGYHKKQGHRQRYTALKILDLIVEKPKAKAITKKVTESKVDKVETSGKVDTTKDKGDINGS